MSTTSSQLRTAEDRVDAATVAERDAFDRFHEAVEADPDERMRVLWGQWQGAESYEDRVAARRSLRFLAYNTPATLAAFTGWEKADDDARYERAVLQELRDQLSEGVAA